MILSSKVEDLPNPAAEAGANPYVFGNAKVTPSLDNKFAKNDELSILFQIYNTGLAADRQARRDGGLQLLPEDRRARRSSSTARTRRC